MGVIFEHRSEAYLKYVSTGAQKIAPRRPPGRLLKQSLGLRRAPPFGENKLGIAIRLRPSLEHQLTSRRESRPVIARRHWRIGRIARILLVYHQRHALQRFQNLF